LPQCLGGFPLKASLAFGLASIVTLSSIFATQPLAHRDIETRIDALLASMTLQEKLGQLQQLDGFAEGKYRDEHLELARKGLLGSTLNVRGARIVNDLQRVAVEESRLKIPLIFAFDVIHGYRTIFPIPLGEAASWDPAAVEQAAAIAAAEARAAGLHWTFAPMVDIARDARWGRIAEGAGEDPYLGSIMASARVRGYQGKDYSRPDKVVATAKHWVAYGAAEAGRDYNTTDLSEHTLRMVYFPPFKAAVDAGVGTFMSAFNDLNGVPASGNPFTLTEVLRNEWKFDGIVVSDYRSIVEMINHGAARDEADAAAQALRAGVDMEMVSRSYVTHGARLVNEGRFSLAAVDDAVRRVLRIKLRAGLFEQPYADEARERTTLLKAEFRAAARQIAARSMVLLKNDRNVLPFSPQVRRLAVIGPLAHDRENMMGNWTGDGRKEDVVTVVDGIKAAVAPHTQVSVFPGVTLNLEQLTPGAQAAASQKLSIDEATAGARAADAAVLVIGETGAMSGEASSRASLDLPGRQLELAQNVIATGKPVAVVLMNGRPLSIGWLAEHAPAIVEAWFPGTEAGNAVADVLFGKVNPGGKLPVSFPRTVGQAPIYYNQKNTGRPPDAKDKYTSKYLDVPWTPLYPFGHGLSYTEFRLSDLRISAGRIAPDSTITISAVVENVGKREGDEVLQLYIQDVVASVVRPVQELKGLRRLTLKPGERRSVEFTIGSSELGFYDRRMRWVVEPGEFRVRVSSSSVGGLSGTFEIVAAQDRPAYKLSAEDDAFLEDLSKRSFMFFWEQADANTGIVRDRSRTDGSPPNEHAREVGSIASVGFGLTGLCIAADRGWVPRAQTIERARTTLRFFAERIHNNHGWFHHFVNIRTGEREYRSEVSSIDTALLLAGVLTVRQCFSADPDIVKYADAIYRRVDFQWMLAGDPLVLSHGWRPEQGFLKARWDHYCELMILYLLGIGSPTFPIPPASWRAWARPTMTFDGYSYVSGPDPLFVHQYSHAWVDFRGLREREPPQIDWFANSMTATRAHKAFCLTLSKDFPGYSEHVWGISASDSQKGYVAWGGPPRHKAIDGSVVPCAAAGSLMFDPSITLPALREMHRKFGDRIYGRYGFADAFHPTSGWVNPDVIGIDLGITLLSAENLRTGKVWSWFMRNEEIPRAMRAAGLTGTF
jgi:beta-glucosidase